MPTNCNRFGFVLGCNSVCVCTWAKETVKRRERSTDVSFRQLLVRLQFHHLKRSKFIARCTHVRSRNGISPFVAAENIIFRSFVSLIFFCLLSHHYRCRLYAVKRRKKLKFASVYGLRSVRWLNARFMFRKQKRKILDKSQWQRQTTCFVLLAAVADWGFAQFDSVDLERLAKNIRQHILIAVAHIVSGILTSSPTQN